MPPTVVGLLAYGMSGQLFQGPWIEASPHFRLKAVVERSVKRAAQDLPAIVSYNSVEELLKDDEIELVVVNTASETHYELAKLALESGKHVIVEKPMTANVAQARELFELARAKKVHLFPYQNMRYTSDSTTIARILQRPEMSAPFDVQFRWDRYRSSLNVKKWKEDPKNETAGLVYDLGPHLVDLAISFFGVPSIVHKSGGAFRPDSKVDDYFHIHLEYKSGLHVYLTSSLLIADSPPAFIINTKRGTFMKLRGDVQEAQLKVQVPVNDPRFGVEESATYGKLTTADENDKLTSETIESDRGFFGTYFQAVADTLADGRLFPITEEQILAQIHILAMPDGCSSF